MDLQTFAEAHGLEIEVKLRPKQFRRGSGDRFYASIPNAEVLDGSVLVGAFGNGDTEEEAIANYARRISERRIALDALRPGRRELTVPQLDEARP